MPFLRCSGGEAVREELLLLIVQSGVGNVTQLCGRREDLDERAMIEAQCEVWVPEKEESALLYCPCSSCHLPTDRVVAGLCSTAELAAHIDGLTPCVATSTLFGGTAAPLLGEPVPHPSLAPIRGQGCRQVGVERSDP